jgi:hypothetical protein
MIPLYPQTGGPYNTLLYFRHSFQGIEPRSRPVKAVEATLVHLHGPQSDSYPMGKCWHFLRKTNGNAYLYEFPQHLYDQLSLILQRLHIL